MGEFLGLEATVKSKQHFPDEPGNWAYFNFGHEYPLAKTATALPALDELVIDEDGVHRTLVHAQRAVDARIRIDVQHLSVLELRLIACWMNAVDGTHLDARHVLRPDAGFGDHVSHTIIC